MDEAQFVNFLIAMGKIASVYWFVMLLLAVAGFFVGYVELHPGFAVWILLSLAIGAHVVIGYFPVGGDELGWLGFVMPRALPCALAFFVLTPYSAATLMRQSVT